MDRRSIYRSINLKYSCRRNFLAWTGTGQLPVIGSISLMIHNWHAFGLYKPGEFCNIIKRWRKLRPKFYFFFSYLEITMCSVLYVRANLNLYQFICRPGLFDSQLSYFRSLTSLIYNFVKNLS